MKPGHYIDANVFVYAALSRDAKGKSARKILARIRDGTLQGYTSITTTDEIMWAVQKESGREDALLAASSMLAITKLFILPVNFEVAQKALHVYRATNLRPRDSFHVAMMRVFDIPTLISEDKDFDKIEGIKRIGLT
ncbi:hypothetical protein CMO91_02875 [Candidatus Woesearchaeota archaeon]|nr:hypothetical protein [Candidatus Woesearchaeota archaeon]|tara:strand:+ start:611 stop:1021 length:411 start_codon:yes stop_codon:yes gene_type:complete